MRGRFFTSIFFIEGKGNVLSNVSLSPPPDELDNKIEDKMVLTMKEKEITHPIKRATADLKLILQMTLVDVANKNSMTLFKNMHLLDDFLEFPADQ